MHELTDKQARVLRFIERFIQRTGMPPTRAEIMQGLGFRSPNAAEAHLRTLARKGRVELLPGASRGIRLVRQDSAWHGSGQTGDAALPIIGQVAAGSPILAEEHIHGHCQVAPTWFRPTAHYLLTVRGNSMRDAGILDGDLLAVHATAEARNGQIVVARIDSDVTVKRFERQGHRVLLRPENPDYTVIEVDLRTQPLVIEGLGVGLLRNGLPQAPAHR